MEALLSRKVDSLEKRVMMKEEEVDLTVDGKGHHSGAGGGDSDATFTVVMHSNTSTGMGGASSNSSGGGDIPQTFGTNNGGRSHTTAPRSLRQMEQEFSVAAEELHGLLNTFQNTLSKLFDLTRVLPPTHPNHLVAQRLQSVLEDRRLQLQRAKQDFQRQLHRLQLVPSIRRDMKAFEENAEVRLLLDEQHSLRSTQSRVHRILDQAESTQDMLRQQKERFEHAANGLVHIMERVPIIKRTLGRIDHRRRREVVCLGCVVGFCLFLALICW